VTTLNENQLNAQATPEHSENSQDNGGERRERRSRDRYGRDRRERGERSDRAPREEGAVQEPLFNAAETEQAPHAAQENRTSHDAPVAQAQAAPATTASPARTGMPRVQAFSLPLAEMQAVAQSSGLEWINSDPARIAAVQAAIAAEPKPVHIPRERPPLVVMDEGPLVLVETRKDL